MKLSREIHKGLVCDTLGRPDSILGRTVCLSAHPGKMLLFPFLKWFEKRYAGRYRYARAIFALDLVLLGVVLTIGVLSLVFVLHQPENIADRIYFDAAVAPREIVAGAPSTLVIRYTNGSEHELRNAVLGIAFPPHFLFQEISTDAGRERTNRVNLGTLAPGQTGTVRVRGVMFGDVGGEQKFKSALAFTFGKRNKPGQKIDEYTFSPAHSTLALELKLPSPVVAEQDIVGTITYKNTGLVDFPEISMEPEWPTEFTFRNSDVPLVDGRLRLPAVRSGQSGEWKFEGMLGAVADQRADFVFHPSFTFGNTHYRQETLHQQSPVIAPPLTLGHSIAQNAIEPGGLITVQIDYENTGTLPVRNAEIGFESTSPFLFDKKLSTNAAQNPWLSEIKPGERGQVQISARVKPSVAQSAIAVHENIQIDIQSYAAYTIGQEQPQTIVSRASSTRSILITPIRLDSFARYATGNGDQLGRGALPPMVGEETKYWIFWNVHGTTNPINQLVIDAPLGKNVRFTGRQSVSQDDGVRYDTATHTVSWNAPQLQSTFSPQSRIVGVAFEVALTPQTDQVGTAPILLGPARATGRDKTTGAFVSASAPAVDTDLPDDPMAAGKASVLAP